MSCLSCSQIVLSTHHKLGEILGALSNKTCVCVLESVLDNLKMQQNELKDIIAHGRENFHLGLRICDLDSILHTKISKAILSVIELIALSHCEKVTGLPAPHISEHFTQIYATLEVLSSDESDGEII